MIRICPERDAQCPNGMACAEPCAGSRTHPLTPREQYEQARRDFNNMRDDGSLASGSGDHSGGVTDMIDHAELAALREHRITADLLVSTLKADKEEAERKLAEAVGLKHLTDGQIFAAINAAVTITRDRNGVDNGAVCISPEKFRTFLSKEAERG